jgi:hypothetical protein
VKITVLEGCLSHNLIKLFHTILSKKSALISYHPPMIKVTVCPEH